MRGALLAVLSLLPSVTLGQSTIEKPANSVLRFEDFRVPSPLAGRKHNAGVSRSDLPTETSAQFERRLVKEARKGPNFAGHYTIVIWSCGSPCANLAIVNIQTGKIYDPPFGGVIGWGNCEEGPGDGGSNPLSYRIDSSLLVITGNLEILDPKTDMWSEGPCGRFYYHWDGHRLSLLRSVVPIEAPLSK
jgi:hypothetical protein